MLDVTMTACRRPEILTRTLASFTKNLLSNIPRRLIINVDPVGADIDSEEVVSIARAFFPEVIANCPDRPSFPKAFKWALSMAESRLVLNVEDDWELLRPVEFQELVALMDNSSDLASLRLAAFHATRHHMKNWNKFFPYDERYGCYLCPEELKRSVGFCGHPSLLRLDFIDQTVPYLDIRANPEKQFHRGHPKIMESVDQWKFGVYSKPDSPPLISDIGRRWMVENKFRKSGSKAFFKVWEKVE